MTKLEPKHYAMVISFTGTMERKSFAVHCTRKFVEKYADFLAKVDPNHTVPEFMRPNKTIDMDEMRFHCNYKLAQFLCQWFHAIPTERAEEALYEHKYV